MRILLTGATGFLGNNLLRQLLDAGHQVTVTLRHSSDPRPLDGLSIERAITDLTDHAQVGPLIAEHDAVIHAAAMIHLGWSKIESSRRFNVGSTQTLAAAARRHGKRMVYVSTVDTLGIPSPDQPGDETNRQPPKPACAYVVSKTAAEAAFAAEIEHGLDGVVVHPGFMVGPRDWKPSSGEMMLAVATKWTPLAPAGGCSVADVNDVARGVQLALEHGTAGAHYILGGHNVTYLELWTAIARVTGARAPVGKLPGWISAVAGCVGDFASRFIADEAQVNSAVVAMGQLHHWYSSAKAQRELGYVFGPYESALVDAWAWFREHDYA